MVVWVHPRSHGSGAGQVGPLILQRGAEQHNRCARVLECRRQKGRFQRERTYLSYPVAATRDPGKMA
jgi:hypothetical protein